MALSFDSPSVIVIGGGVIGLMTAQTLHDRGMAVTVIDAGMFGAEASWAGGGIVSPVPPWGYPGGIDRMVARSRELYPQLVERLERATGIDCEYRTCGLLLTGGTGSDTARAWLEANAQRVRTGPAQEFERLVSAGAAVEIADIAQVRNPRLCRALVEYLDWQGVELWPRSPVAQLLTIGDQVCGVRLEDGRALEADLVVLAAGAWSDDVLRNNHLPGLGIEPVRGQMLLFKPDRPLLRHIVHTGRQYLIPRVDQRILCGSTVEHVGFDCRVTAEAWADLHTLAVDLLPALADVSVEAHWAGLRPGIDSGMPAIGPYPGMRGLWLNTGHYRNGLGMAPAAAEWLADQLSADQAGPSPFEAHPAASLALG